MEFEDNKYNQVCVWQGTLVGEDRIEEFENFFYKKGFRVKYIEEIKTFPDKDKNGNDIPETGGRNDIFFYIHDDDIMKFAIKRLMMEIRWIEDILAEGNYRSPIYPERVFNYKTWG